MYRRILFKVAPPWSSYFSGLGICSSVFWAIHSLFVRERVKERFAHKKEWIVHSRSSCVMSDLSKSLTVALLSWAAWANHSRLLFCKDRWEQIAQDALQKRTNEWRAMEANHSSRSLKKRKWRKSDKSNSLLGIKRGKTVKKHMKNTKF